MDEYNLTLKNKKSSNNSMNLSETENEKINIPYNSPINLISSSSDKNSPNSLEITLKKN
jgi:hypothetical protein